MNDFLATTTASGNGCMLPGGIYIGSDDDLRRMTELLARFPSIEQAIAQRIVGQPAAAIVQQPIPAPAPIVIQPPVASAQTLVPSPQVDAPLAPVATAQRFRAEDPGTWPKKPMRWCAAVEGYLTYHSKTLKIQNDRTGNDKERLFKAFHEFLVLNHPELGDDPWVHRIDSSHVAAFMAEQAERPGKRVAANGEKATAAPRTLLKKLSDLLHTFGYLRTVAKATFEKMDDDLAATRAVWQARADYEDVHYLPFSDAHIKAIFSTETYLASNREPAYFWCPLLGVHLGVRLGEVVDVELANVGHIPEIDVWYIDVRPEDAKNKNSVRRSPITAPLVDLGFIDYVKHVRALGAIHLFPNCSWDSPTLQRDPSKNASRAFGAHLDTIGLVDRDLVFHSFRHTAVSAMQDAGVPLSHAMQIAGHEAQAHAVRTGKITETEARSVHLSVYTHAELERMGTQYPILPLKSALEKSLHPPIDYNTMRVAAKIVLQHTRKVGREFKAGWPAQRQSYTDEQIAILRQSMKT